MSEITFQSVKKYIHDRTSTSFDPVYLIFGEEYLYKQVVSDLLNAIIPDRTKQKHHYEIVRQKEDGMLSDVIERMNTYSFLSEKKIVELRDSTVFVSRQNPENILQKTRLFYESNEIEKAVRMFLDLLGRLHLDLDDMAGDEDISEKLNISEDHINELEWIKKLSLYCKENGFKVPEVSDDAELLKKSIENGFCKDNYLFISTDTVDKRKGLYKTIKKFGTVIDCSVSTGNRKAERDEQRRFLLHHVQELMGRHNKQLDPQVFDMLLKMTGFNLRSFSSNLEKLIDYSGVRDRITVDDAKKVLNKTSQDPVYELTGAISERNTLKALHFLTSLLSSGFHYLQILAAITNQIRKLIVIKGFLETPDGKGWQPGMTFDRFKTHVMPSVQKHDEILSAHIQESKTILSAGSKNDSTKSKDKPQTDLIIAKNPNNSYPIYQLFLRSDNFSVQDLYRSFEALSDSDIRLKTTGQSPRLVLEGLILNICTNQNNS